MYFNVILLSIPFSSLLYEAEERKRERIVRLSYIRCPFASHSKRVAHFKMTQRPNLTMSKTLDLVWLQKISVSLNKFEPLYIKKLSKDNIYFFFIFI